MRRHASRIGRALLTAAITLVAAAAAPRAQEPTVPTGQAPSVRPVALLDFYGSFAIWGATGADRGLVYVGVASNHDETGSAHLLRYDPVADVVKDMGNVLDKLRQAGVRRDGEKQMKIHSRIVPMPDGFLYFASMDETGENPNGSKMPTWGGHLWRMSRAGVWEHLARTPEALIAVAGGGRYVYALGYFNHVLHQFDTQTGKTRSLTVGSVGGHISRNFIVDDRGHAYVPRLTKSADAGKPRVDVTLVEFGTDLQEVGSNPLPEYLESGPDDSHGIVAVHPDGAGGWFFATGKGRLYHVTPAASGPAALKNLGWYHPSGPRYVASMFRDPATGTLYGVAHVPGSNRRFEWVTRPPNGETTVAPFPYGESSEFPGGALLYGSMTRDAAGRFYIVGTMSNKPVLLQVAATTAASGRRP